MIIFEPNCCEFAFDMSKICKAISDIWIRERNEEFQELIEAILSGDDSVVDSLRIRRYEKMMQQTTPIPLDCFNNTKNLRERGIQENVEKSRFREYMKRRTRTSERLSQSDISSIALHASQPVPPTILNKGGNHSVLDCGV